MGRSPDYKKRFVQIIQALSDSYPTFGIGRHISTALSDYGDYWGISDKELCFAMEKYQAELALDSDNIVSDEYLKDIVEDAQHLFDEREEEDGY